ncbi:nucleotidyltransferase domain-containing protein [Sphingomonas sp. MS122]|uniref:nucleotidyltransferase domain-containing protein n=1 Tax=Sphingomonas sp. MS122 TaxID=3412683 RepID=UPI003C2C914F
MPRIDAEPLATLLACLVGEAPQDADWLKLLTTANQALVTGVLAARIGDGPPEEVQAFLEVIHRRALERNARLKTQLEEATTSLNAAGIQPVLLKGTALLNTAGPDYGARILSDLDIMVPARSMASARQNLEAIGYRIYRHEDSPLVPLNLYREQDVGMVDLHCRTKSRYPGFDFEDLVRDCVEVTLGGARAWLPSPTSQALILILHDQLQERDYWRGLIDLRHLLDIAELARTPVGIDWARLAAHFPRGYPRNALDVQLATLELLFGVPMPQPHRPGWTRFQLQRRIVQLRRPGFRSFLTLLTLLLDPPRQSGLSRQRATAIGPGRFSNAPMPARLRHARSVLDRLLARKNPGKI